METDMSISAFTGVFTQQEALPEVAQQAALAQLASGRLHRYNTVEGETAETVLLEQEFAEYMGAKYCLACTSGGYALHIGLLALGLEKGEAVMTNAYTLSPVPGAIVNAGGVPVLVEITDDLVLDLEDLVLKIEQSGAKKLMLSHMRGYLVDMTALMAICDQHGVDVIEDCAHTMGASWNGIKSGKFGKIACYSTQTYKHINSGEGGLIISDDEDIIAKCVLHSGSYMLYETHTAAPSAEVFERHKYITPNFSGRMDNLRAAILRPQLANLDQSIERWNKRYHIIAECFKQSDVIVYGQRSDAEYFVGSSLQFRLPTFSFQQMLDYVAACNELGVVVKWFGEQAPKGYTSNHHSWQYINPQPCPKTDKTLSTLCDIRIPLTFTEADCQHISEILCYCAEFINQQEQ
jgi:dTDP-4-amino-4,6-dideoxygalactose transaminase